MMAPAIKGLQTESVAMIGLPVHFRAKLPSGKAPNGPGGWGGGWLGSVSRRFGVKHKNLLNYIFTFGSNMGG